ncbi:MAG: NAD-dependent epimerase/dehydratase family protein [Myxococcota bacterium]
MRVFVTGATGFIGSHVMQQLLERGDDVLALSRRGRNAPHLEGNDHPRLEVVTGDLLTPSGYRDALASCDAVVHIAGWISTKKRDAVKLHAINVEATEQLWNACRETSTRRIVYLASIFAHGRGRGTRPCDETVSFDPAILELPVPYFRAKREAELMTWRHVERFQMPIVFGYPGFCIGPGDTYLSSMRVVRDHLRGRAPAYVRGGMSFIDVRDAAAGLIGCLDDGRVGEKYLLSNHNLSWTVFFGTLRKVTGARLPAVPLPKRPAMLLGRIAEKLSLEDLVSEGDLAVMGTTWFYDASKARRELGLPSRPLEESLRDGVAWFRRHP